MSMFFGQPPSGRWYRRTLSATARAAGVPYHAAGWSSTAGHVTVGGLSWAKKAAAAVAAMHAQQAVIRTRTDITRQAPTRLGETRAGRGRARQTTASRELS